MDLHGSALPLIWDSRISGLNYGGKAYYGEKGFGKAWSDSFERSDGFLGEFQSSSIIDQGEFVTLLCRDCGRIDGRGKLG